MARKLILFICLILAGSFAWAKDYEQAPFNWVDPVVMGQGGAFTATADGYTALFTNPAGFALGKGDITFLSTSAWLYANPGRLGTLIDNLGKSGSGDEAGAMAVAAVNEEITSGGLGFGNALGFGYVKNGLGLGLSLVTDTFLMGDNAFGTEGTLTGTIGLIGGYALPIDLFFGKLLVGGDVRPMVRIHSALSATEAVGLFGSVSGGGDFTSVLENAKTLHGFGFSMDAGALLKMGDFNFGLVIRDLFGGHFFYNSSTWGEMLKQGLSAGAAASDGYSIPMNMIAGAAWHPDLGALSQLIDPTVMFDIQDLITVIRDGRTFWTTVHIGAEAKIISVLAVRAGLNQGYLTFGCGLDLFIFDLNFAMFTRELGKFLTDKPNSGMSLELALRL